MTDLLFAPAPPAPVEGPTARLTSGTPAHARALTLQVRRLANPRTRAVLNAVSPSDPDRGLIVRPRPFILPAR